MALKKPIYLDYNATTPLDPQVLEAMLPYLKEDFGNPSSQSHAYGWEASNTVKKSRAVLAEALGAHPENILFTSGATESNNLAILGYLKTLGSNAKAHIITTAVEHKAVLDVCQCAERELGIELTILPVNEYGQVSPDDIQKALRPHTKLVSVMMANNEIGSINPIQEIGALLKNHTAVFHVDAAQAYGKMKIDVDTMGIDFLSISGHKIYGPKGVGALFWRHDKYPIQNLMCGGAQEKGLRPGTLNVPGIVGLAKATEVALQNLEQESLRLCQWRDELIQSVLSASENVLLNGHPTERLCNNANFSFKNLSADVFTLGLSGLALSSGSACTSGDPQPSHVLLALGHSEALARATVRIGLGRFTNHGDVRTAIERVTALIEKNQEISTL